MGTTSFDWAQLSMFYLKKETESSLQNVVFFNKKKNGVLDKNRAIDNVQQCHICIYNLYSSPNIIRHSR
jgi:hypothetical protein